MSVLDGHKMTITDSSLLNQAEVSTLTCKMDPVTRTVRHLICSEWQHIITSNDSSTVVDLQHNSVPHKVNTQDCAV